MSALRAFRYFGTKSPKVTAALWAATAALATATTSVPRRACANTLDPATPPSSRYMTQGRGRRCGRAAQCGGVSPDGRQVGVTYWRIIGHHRFRGMPRAGGINTAVWPALQA